MTSTSAGTACLAACLAAGAVLLAPPRRRTARGRPHRRVGPGRDRCARTGPTCAPAEDAPGSEAPARGGADSSTGSQRALAVLVGLAAAVLIGTSTGTLEVGAGAAAGLLVLVVAAERGRGRRRSEVARVRDGVDEGLAALAAALAAGRPPPAALHAASEAAPYLAEAARLAALGADPVPALRAVSARPGAEPMADLAAAWGVALCTGAPLTPVVQRVRGAVAARTAADREAAEQLAPVHATGRVLAVLPVLGLGLGGALGVDSLRLLTTTGWGQACLLLAVVLVAVGLAWLDALTRAALR
jgi:tight adherence protein B